MIRSSRWEGKYIWTSGRVHGPWGSMISLPTWFSGRDSRCTDLLLMRIVPRSVTMGAEAEKESLIRHTGKISQSLGRTGILIERPNLFLLCGPCIHLSDISSLFLSNRVDQLLFKLPIRSRKSLLSSCVFGQTKNILTIISSVE